MSLSQQKDFLAHISHTTPGDFQAETYGEGYVDLQMNDRVAVVKDDEDGWMYGKNFGSGEIGWFPASYVKSEGTNGDPRPGYDTYGENYPANKGARQEPEVS